MSTKPVLPTLSKDGWVTTPLKTMDYLLSHYYESDYSQSYTFKGKVKSFAKVLMDNQGDVRSLETALRADLEAYLGRYFSVVNVSVEVDQEETVTGTMEIFLSFGDDELETYTLGHVVRFIDSKFVEVVSRNNYGHQ